MTPKEFARRFAEFMSGGGSADDADRPMTDDEMELIHEVVRVAGDPQGRARMRQIIRGIPTALYHRHYAPEHLSEILEVTPDAVCRMAEAGRLTGTYGPDGWRFGLADLYRFLFPDEPEGASPAP